MSTLIVIAKAPRPGFSKTRLTPPFSPSEAAALAEAALRDTLAAVAQTPARRRLVVLDGDRGSWLPEGFDVVPQRAGDLGERLEGAFAAVDGPALLVGMDTPQLTPALLQDGLRTLAGHDAVLGRAPDGGYWAVGLRRAVRGAFTGVPMSRDDTAARQLERFAALGLSVGALPELEDVDTAGTAARVARAAPMSAFARRLAELSAVGAR